MSASNQPRLHRQGEGCYTGDKPPWGRQKCKTVRPLPFKGERMKSQSRMHLTALATGVVGDAQMQARDLLSGTVGGRSTFADVSSAIPTDDRHVLNLDPQEQARDLILGKHFAATADQAANFDSKTDATIVASVQRTDRADIDGQELARRMLLGKGV